MSADLLNRLAAFDIDGAPASLPFAARLAREHGWTRRFADRVVADYEQLIAQDQVDLVFGPFSTRLVVPSARVAQEYGIEAIGRESEWARLQQGMSFSSTNGGLHRWSTGSSRGPATAMPVPGARGEEETRRDDDEAERSATIAPV